MNWNEIKNNLQAPFPSTEIEWRVARAGQKNGKVWAFVLAYVTNRAIQNRLDNVFGVTGWKNEYTEAPNGGLMCGLSVWDEDKKQWITKWDGAENTEFEAVKGGLSGAMKRSAVQWGIGRYLYGLTENFAIVNESGSNRDKFKDKESGKNIYFKWDPPRLPDWALPDKQEHNKQDGAPIKTGFKKSDVIDIMKKKIKNPDDLARQFKKMIVDAFTKEYGELGDEKTKEAASARINSIAGKNALAECSVDELENILRSVK